MHKLALTCQVLYDKDYLDNILLLKKKERHPIVLFKDIFIYFNSVKRFQIKIRNFVEDSLNKEEIWNELIKNISNPFDTIIYIKSLRNVLTEQLFEFTRKKEKKWCEETSIIFIHAVKGSIKGLYLCFENNIEAITPEFIKNITLSTIFHMIGTHEEYQGIFDKISYFKCDKCKNLTNEVVHEEKQLCMECFT